MKEVALVKKLHQKDEIIQKQGKRISLLEEKFAELRSKYFHLKYEEKIHLHPSK